MKTGRSFSIPTPERITADPRRFWATSISFSQGRVPARSHRRADRFLLKEADRSHRDPSAETDVDVRTRRPMAQLIIAGVIEVALFFVAIIEGQWIWIE